MDNTGVRKVRLKTTRRVFNVVQDDATKKWKEVDTDNLYVENELQFATDKPPADCGCNRKSITI